MTIVPHEFQEVYVPFFQKTLVLKLGFPNFAIIRNSTDFKKRGLYFGKIYIKKGANG
jgi:hypothetical protein